MSTKEAQGLLSAVRLGVAQGIVSGISLDTLNSLLVELQPNTLTLNEGKELSPQDRDKLRAELIKEQLK